MTVEKFRQKKIRNFSLAWEIYGHKIPRDIEEFEKFSVSELEIIQAKEEDDTELVEMINLILSDKCHWR